MKAWTLVVVAGAAVLSLADYLEWRAAYGELTASSRAVGLAERVPDLDRELRRQAGPARATIRAAWLLLATELDRSWREQLSAEERAAEDRRGILRLELAGRLAAEGLAAQPVSWRAAAVLGGSRYLLGHRRPTGARPAAGWREPPDVAHWREPLLAAMRLAPGHPEPPRLLASSYLSVWSGLARSEREAAVPVIARTFEDRRSFDLLVAAWVRLAPSLDRLLEPVPDRSWAWDRLGRELLARGDLERFCTVRERWYEAAAAELPARLASAATRLRGDRRRALGIYSTVLALPADVALAEGFAAALAALPPELVDGRMRGDLRRWAGWALELCVAGFCPLPAATWRALGERLDDLDGAEAAMVALLAEDPARARHHESRGAAAGEATWDRYLLLATRRSLDTGQAAAARAALDRVPADGRQTPLYWLEAERLAEAEGDRQRAAAARRQLAELAGTGWPADRWRHREGVYRLELLAAEAAAGIRIEPRWAPSEGTVLELRWDGRRRQLVTVVSGTPVRWRLPVTAGPHLLEVSDTLGRRATPGAVILEPAGVRR